MDLKKYFESKNGTGVLSTADSNGVVDAAIYARPHVENDETVAFIMANKLSYSNIKQNPHAVYLFREDGQGYQGKRLFLTKVSEVDDQDKIKSLRRRKYSPVQEEEMKPLCLVTFKVDRELPLVGE